MTIGGGDGQWTHRIKEQLIQIAHGQGYMVCASGVPDNVPEECQPDWPEWLYDITLLDGHNDGAGVIDSRFMESLSWPKSSGATKATCGMISKNFRLPGPDYGS